MDKTLLLLILVLVLLVVNLGVSSASLYKLNKEKFDFNEEDISFNEDPQRRLLADNMVTVDESLLMSALQNQTQDMSALQNQAQDQMSQKSFLGPGGFNRGMVEVQDVPLMMQ